MFGPAEHGGEVGVDDGRALDRLFPVEIEVSRLQLLELFLAFFFMTAFGTVARTSTDRLRQSRQNIYLSIIR
jgi:hypothetical protein